MGKRSLQEVNADLATLEVKERALASEIQGLERSINAIGDEATLKLFLAGKHPQSAQLAAKRMEWAALREEIDAQRIERDALSKAAEEDRRSDAQFWVRRFHTSLALANGAGLAATASRALEPSANAYAIWWGGLDAVLFGFGLLIAGVVPHELYFERLKRAWTLATISAAVFAFALLMGLAAIGAYAWSRGSPTLPPHEASTPPTPKAGQAPPPTLAPATPGPVPPHA